MVTLNGDQNFSQKISKPEKPRQDTLKENPLITSGNWGDKTTAASDHAN